MTPQALQEAPTSLQEALAEKAAILRRVKNLSLDTLADIPPVLDAIKKPSRYKGLHGGRGGMKSHTFATLLLERCCKSRVRAVCVREFQVTLEQSVKRLLEDKIELYGLQDKFRIYDNYIACPFEGIIIFQGMQAHTSESIKSLEGYNIAWVEEAQSLSQRSLDLLRPTIREEGSELWFSWNPRHKTDPVDVFLRGEVPPPDAIVLKTTYRDNPYFPSVLKTEMEWDRNRDPEKYAHIWMGEYEKHSESRVFKNWRVEEFEAPLNSIFYLGGDWGFSVDPTTLVRCRPEPEKRRLYIDYECFQIGTEIDFIPTLFDGLICGCVPEKDGTVLRPCLNPTMHGDARKWELTADSARPETISYIQRHGYPRIIAAKKGPDSVKEGVIFLQNYDIIVHPRCVHTVDELTMYSYKVDKLTNIVTPILEDKKNHIIDPLRYATEKLRAGEEFVSW